MWVLSPDVSRINELWSSLAWWYEFSYYRWSILYVDNLAKGFRRTDGSLTWGDEREELALVYVVVSTWL